MKEIVYDVIIPIIILGILVVAISMFKSNLKLINQSASYESDNAQLTQTEGDKAYSFYTGHEIIANLEKCKISEHSEFNIKNNSIIKEIKKDSSELQIDSIISYIKDNNLLDKRFKYDDVSKTYLKVDIGN